MNSNGSPTAEAIAEAEQAVLEQQSAALKPYITPEPTPAQTLLASEIAAQQAVVNQRLAAFTATEQFQLYQQAVGVLSYLNEKQAALVKQEG